MLSSIDVPDIQLSTQIVCTTIPPLKSMHPKCVKGIDDLKKS